MTAVVLRTTSRKLECRLECGPERGQRRQFDTFEIVGCTEVFGSSLLKNLLKLAKSAL